jgi:hypothetical protein
MQYELWARSRESKVYEFQDSFTDESEKYYRIDTVDTEVYDEAMVLITDFDKEPKMVLYQELDKKPKNNIREENYNESVRKYKK